MSAASSTAKWPAERSSSQRAISYACIGVQESVLSTSTSSVPFSSATESPGRFYPETLQASGGESKPASHHRSPEENEPRDDCVVTGSNSLLSARLLPSWTWRRRACDRRIAPPRCRRSPTTHDEGSHGSRQAARAPRT